MAKKSGKSLRKEFWERVAQFAQRAAGSEKKKPEPSTEPRNHGIRPVDVAVFANKVKQVLDRQGVATGGTIYIVDLSQFREQLGDKWPQLAGRVEMMVDAEIRRRLTPVDLYAKLGGSAFVIVFGSLTQDEAKLKCALIAEEVRKRLVGVDSALEDVKVGSAVAHLDQKTWVEDIDLENLTRNMIQSQADEAVKAPRFHLRERSPRDTGQDFGTPAVQWRMRSKGPRGSRPGPDPLPSDSESADPLSSDSESTVTSSLESTRIHFVYRPMWDVRREVLSTYFCRPVRLDSSSQGTIDDDLPMGRTVAEVVDLDILTLQKVIGDLKALVEKNRRVLVGLPMRFRTLGAPLAQRTKLVEVLHTIPDELRRLLIVEIVDVPDGTPGTRLVDIVETIKPFTRAVYLQTNLGLRNFSRLGEMRIFAVGLDTHSLEMDEDDCIEVLQEFAEAANALGLRTYIHGLRSLSLTAAAVCAGFDYVGGDTVASIIDAPEEMYKYRFEDLFRELAESAKVLAGSRH